MNSVAGCWWGSRLEAAPALPCLECSVAYEKGIQTCSTALKSCYFPQSWQWFPVLCSAWTGFVQSDGLHRCLYFLHWTAGCYLFYLTFLASIDGDLVTPRNAFSNLFLQTPLLADWGALILHLGMQHWFSVSLPEAELKEQCASARKQQFFSLFNNVYGKIPSIEHKLPVCLCSV